MHATEVFSDRRGPRGRTVDWISSVAAYNMCFRILFFSAQRAAFDAENGLLTRWGVVAVRGVLRASAISANFFIQEFPKW